VLGIVMVRKKTERILISISVPQVRDFILPKHTVLVVSSHNDRAPKYRRSLPLISPYTTELP
jgi:hypothetical protein